MSEVVSYQKPAVRPEPRFDPPVLSADEIFPAVAYTETMEATEMVYHVARSQLFCSDETKQVVPHWGAFHVLSPPPGKPEMDTSNIAFNPILMAPPNDPATIYTTLLRSKEAANSLGFDHVPVFFDMGLLTKALEITWANPESLAGVIPCDGGMHFVMSILAGIGAVYGDAGLRSLLVDSGLFASGTVSNILTGKDFEKAVFAMKVIDEALTKRLLIQFKKWCVVHGHVVPEELDGALADLSDSFATGNSRAIEAHMVNLQMIMSTEMLPLLNDFRTDGRESSPTFKFWDDFLKRVLVPLKLFLIATRRGDWSVYQAAKAKLIPHLFASNRTIYARYQPILCLQMKRLPEPVGDAFRDGLFVSKLTRGAFNGVWIDYTLEATENKALKGTGGIIGLTLKGDALARWFLARPVSAKYSVAFRDKVTGTALNRAPGYNHSNTPASKRKWDQSVDKLVRIFDDAYVDPFSVIDPPARLVNFATGMIATPEVEASMMSCLDRGEASAKKFVEERLVDTEGDSRRSLYDPLSRTKLLTMSDMKKRITIGSKTLAVNSEMMYLRLMALNAKKKVPLDRVMSYENSPVPLSLFQEDGSMCQNVKSEFMHKLESLIPGDKITAVNNVDSIIFDGHAVIQMMPQPTHMMTFNELANVFMRYIINSSKAVGSTQTHIVFDQYYETSIKQAVREKRGYTSGH